MIKYQHANKRIQCQDEFNTPLMQKMLQNIEQAIASPVKVLKDDPASTVVLIKVEDQLMVIKRANTKHWSQALRRSLSRSRAQKNWVNAKKLLALGIPTFKPIATVEEKWGPICLRSYFICEYIQGVDALHYFACGAKPQPQWPVVAQQMSDLIDVLSNNWISHRDLNLSNIILVDNKPWLIDLDSMRQHRLRLTARRGARRERQRFMKNWQDAPDLSEEVATLFWAIFHQKN